VTVDVHRYWPFALLNAVVLIAVLRLLLRERITLQGSISYLGFVGVFLLMALFPGPTARLAHAMGFELLSNFLFSLGIMALALLHLRALITVSRLETRTIHLTQDLALLEEQFRRVTKDAHD
jgi:hypothetical protein